MPEGPKFSCPECGKQYPWKPELAGKKGKCKCGAIMSVPNAATGVAAKVRDAKGSSSMMGTKNALHASRPAPTPKPVAMPGVDYGDDVVEEVVAPPAYSPTPEPAAAPTGRATGTKFTPKVETETSEKPPLKWAAAWQYFAVGVAVLGLAFWELADPTDPNATRVRKWNLPIYLANKMHPMAGFFILLAFAGVSLVLGYLVLIGKAKDADYEHAQAQAAWPSSRGRR